MDSSTSGISGWFDPPTSGASNAAIGSPAPAAGKSPVGKRAGKDRSGPPRAHASRSPSPEKDEGSWTNGTCGRTYFPSSPLADLGSSWANRLALRLAAVGSTECDLIWKRSAMPSGASIFQLRPSTRRTDATGSTGSQWPTPTVADVTGGRKTRSGERNDEMLLNGLMGSWSTPRASDGQKGGPNMNFGAGGTPLPSQMNQTRSGPTPNGSTAPTEKRGVPNADFACWLMGWPDALICGAWRGIRSVSRSRGKC